MKQEKLDKNFNINNRKKRQRKLVYTSQEANSLADMFEKKERERKYYE